MSLEGKQILLVDRADEVGAEAAALRALGLRVSVATDPDAALLLSRRDEFDMAMIGVGNARRGRRGSPDPARGRRARAVDPDPGAAGGGARGDSRRCSAAPPTT